MEAKGGELNIREDPQYGNWVAQPGDRVSGWTIFATSVKSGYF